MHGETGFGLIEVVVSSMILMLVAIGTFSLLDGSQRTAGENRFRAQAADLAEQDQERLRSTRVLDLSNYSAITPMTVGGVKFSVASKATWLRDASGAPVTCASGTGQAEYMQITSTVTDGNGAANFDPVTLTSLVTPDVGTYGAGTGTLAVEVDDRDGLGQPGIDVTITKTDNTKSGTKTTDASGCAVFDYYPTGSYTVTFQKAGYVTPLGVNAVSFSGQVNSGATNKATAPLYDEAASMTLTTKTCATSCSGNTSLAATTFDAPSAVTPVSPVTNTLTVANSGIANGNGGRLFYTNTGATASVSGLFPFANGDTVYAGACATMEPSTAGAPANFYSTAPGNASLVALTPGQNSTGVALQPWVKAKVKYAGAYVSGAVVYAKETTCGAIYRFPVVTDATGLVQDALPYGTYKFCATSNGRQDVQTKAVASVTAPVTPADIDITSSDPSGTCTAW